MPSCVVFVPPSPLDGGGGGDKYEHFSCLSVINCITINFYQTNEPLQEYCVHPELSDQNI